MTGQENHDTAAEQAIALAHRLMDAAREGDAAILRKYLDAGAPATLTNAAGDTLVMLAAYNGHASVVEDLLARGGDANTANDRGQTPLAGAVFKGYADVARVLLDAGADPDAGTPSARDAAKMFSRPEMLQLFS